MKTAIKRGSLARGRGMPRPYLFDRRGFRRPKSRRSRDFGRLLPSARDGDLVLGVAQPLLGVPAVDLFVPALGPLDERPRFLHLAARLLDVDVLGAHGVVDEDDR